MLALSLLLAAQQPNVPVELKLTAIEVAQNAIRAATEPQVNPPKGLAAEEPKPPVQVDSCASKEGTIDVKSDVNLYNPAKSGRSVEFLITLSNPCNLDGEITAFSTDGVVRLKGIKILDGETYSLKMPPGTAPGVVWEPRFEWRDESVSLPISVIE